MCRIQVWKLADRPYRMAINEWVATGTDKQLDYLASSGSRMTNDKSDSHASKDKSPMQLAEGTICPPETQPDLLSEVLQDLRLARASYGRSELTAPWGIEIPFKEGVRFHFVAEGSCWMLTASQVPIFMECGDVVLLPHGTGHVIADSPARRPVPLDEFGPELIGNSTYRLSAGGGGDRSTIVC